MKPLCTILTIWFLLPFLLCLSASAQQTNSMQITWDWTPPPPPDSITNYVFILHSATTPAGPLPWPVIATAVGAGQFTTSVSMTNWETRVFYVGVAGLLSGPTNNAGESPPSNFLWSTAIPGVRNSKIMKVP